MKKARPTISKKTPVKFVKASHDNIMTINRLAQEIWRQHYPSIIGADTVEYMLDLMYAPEVIKKDLDSGLEYFLLEFKDKEIGYLGIKEEPDKLFLSRIYIKKEYRGMKIGKQSIDYICKIAKDRKLLEVYLTVAKTNKTSIDFYKNCGFNITDAIYKKIGKGFTMDDHIMSKRI